MKLSPRVFVPIHRMALLVVAGFGMPLSAQEPRDAGKTLVNQHPEVRALDAELAGMKARVAMKKLEIGQQMLHLLDELKEARAAVSATNAELEKIQGLPDPNKMAESLKTTQSLAVAKVERLERMLKLIRQVQETDSESAATAEPADPFEQRRQRRAPTMRRLEKLLPAMEEEAEVDFSETTLGEVFQFLAKAHKMKILIHRDLVEHVGETKISLELDEEPLGAVFQAIEDLAPELQIVVREYGLLVVSREANENELGYTSAVDTWLHWVRESESDEEDQMKSARSTVSRSKFVRSSILRKSRR